MGILSRLASAGLSHADDALRSSADEAGDAVRAMLRESPVIRAYHGSPYDFDRFDASKIGTGEGAQAYGYGHYFGGHGWHG